ncbi:unnamed protein product [Prorocentrum cordatum]|uniref:Uncharacterized protein n=1 Tax=Prorocentrum cordatum TaxID=2364126 RepID=A0ABN9Y212_9DINO|nr:unnamed protein product [Polarella glacialis]
MFASAGEARSAHAQDGSHLNAGSTSSEAAGRSMHFWAPEIVGPPERVEERGRAHAASPLRAPPSTRAEVINAVPDQAKRPIAVSSSVFLLSHVSALASSTCSLRVLRQFIQLHMANPAAMPGRAWGEAARPAPAQPIARTGAALKQPLLSNSLPTFSRLPSSD